MAKRVSMKGRGLEAVYGEFRTAPVRRTAGVDVYGQGGAPAKEADSSLLKATFYLDRETIELLERLWLDQRRSGRILKKKHTFFGRKKFQVKRAV